ncbi:hypothetical protein [Nocardioides sp.]|uniref:hypothetical protein n=1 Tax=Nocardioides sp. TaxID=35761 RepID=UPI00262CA9DD|nr:hypothetical protein [Nocardioides sp.]
MPFSPVGRVLAVVALVAATLSLHQSSNADDWYAGIPLNDGTVNDDWVSAAGGGMGYSKLAMQWFRSPAAMTIARTVTYNTSSDPLAQGTWIHAQAYLVSPGGAPGNYGYMAPVTVRSVGFGLMPVEATLQMSQRRKDGYPLPLLVDLKGVNYQELVNGQYHNTVHVMDPVVVDDSFNVSILRVKIDGQDVGLKPGCRTVTPAPVHLVGPGHTIDTPQAEAQWYATHDPKSYFNPLYGGYMAGTITIPAFKGCITRTGDDISALMTKSASGPGNPIEARSSWPCLNPDLKQGVVVWPVAPGKNTPKKAGCEGVKEDPYPTTAPQ